VLPENRDRRKRIGGSIQDQPCRRCFQRGVKCYLVNPNDSLCEGCRKQNIRCNWNLEGANTSTAWQDKRKAQQRARHEELGFVPVPRNQKCFRCTQNKIACNGEHPCNKCNTTLLSLPCRPQGVEELPSCIQCSSGSSGQRCDRGRPCKACINRKSNCTYEVQDGLVTKLYRVLEAPFPSGFSSMGPLADGESSDEECIRCQRNKLNCDGEQPCYLCVKVQGKYKVASCKYRRSDGTYESWAVRPFESNNIGEQTLREDYERYTGRRKLNVSRELKAFRDTFKTRTSRKKQHDAEIEDNETNARQRTARGSLKQFKFGLSAYSKHRLPASLELKMSGTKKEELKSHKERGTWDVVPLPKGVKPVTSRWVTTDKYGPDGKITKQKARLVARGFQQEEGIDYEETFASVVKPASTRILLALAAILHWHIHQGDLHPISLEK
jgi:hypothetical protein